MIKSNVLSPEVNMLILNRLKAFPDEVAEVALKAIELSESLPEATVLESLQGQIRDIVRRRYSKA